MLSSIITNLKEDTVNEIASKILALLPEIILPIFIQSINKYLPSINLINYLGLVLCCVLNSTNASHDEPQYALLYRILTGHLKTGSLITQCLSSAYGNRNRVSRVNYHLPKVRGFVKSNYPFNWYVDKYSYRVCTKCIPLAFVLQILMNWHKL